MVWSRRNVHTTRRVSAIRYYYLLCKIVLEVQHTHKHTHTYTHKHQVIKNGLTVLVLFQAQLRPVFSTTDDQLEFDTQVARGIGKKFCNVVVEDEAVTGPDGRGNTIVHTARCRFPCQTTLRTIQLKSANKPFHPPYHVCIN